MIRVVVAVVVTLACMAALVWLAIRVAPVGL
jgi:hypothetical protein